MKIKPLDNLKIRIVGPLVLWVLGALIFRFQVYLTGSLESRLRYLFVALFYHFICWHIARWVIMYIQEKNPGLTLLKERLRILLIFMLPTLTLLAYFLRFYTHQIILNFPNPVPSITDFASGIGAQLFFNCIYIAVYEGLYLISEWRKAYEENEKLLKLQWQTRFDLLKNQINPHFLFNSLNTLSALISENPNQAELFVHEMSKVYRHLLQSNQNALVTLAVELKFIDSYFHLLKTRFGNGVFLNNEIPPQYLAYQIPPLTLQILLENAFKHNVISEKKPLIIDFKVDESGMLVVQNNIQRKTINIKSDGVGLVNISEKYDLMSNDKIQIVDDGVNFKVILPLINPIEVAEKI
jgi:sensor histidine kinase YesM